MKKQFKSKFIAGDRGHRFKMLQLMHGLATEINKPVGSKVGGPRSLVRFAQEIGWLDKKYLVRDKRIALSDLVKQAKQGFGYVPSPGIRKAMVVPTSADARASV